MPAHRALSLLLPILAGGCLFIPKSDLENRLKDVEHPKDDSAIPTDDSSVMDDSGTTDDSATTDDTACQTDVDLDGYVDGACGGTDCDDTRNDVHPGAVDLPCDGIDMDCSGEDSKRDSDHDGAESVICGGDDCDDNNALVYPGAPEIACDDIDNDCDGAYKPTDGDGDGVAGSECGGADCDDSNAAISPSAPEIPCDSVDDNCDGYIENIDSDGDGYLANSCGGDDCNDADTTIHPGALDLTCDGVDNDCDTVDGATDLDRDGYIASSCGGPDCDDTDISINPGVPEIYCNGVDEDCDGIDGIFDVDGDGYMPTTCGGNDCNDNDSAINPAALEICDNADNDCDGKVDIINALYFDTITDTVDLTTTTPALDLSSNWTVETWIYPIAPGAGYDGVFVKGESLLYTTEMKLFALFGGAPYTQYNTGSAIVASASPNRVTLGAWNHIAWVGKGGVLSIYLNGSQDVSGAADTNVLNDAFPAALGGFSSSASSLSYPSFIGYLSQFRVSNYGRYITDFAPDANYGSDAGTTAFWGLDEGSGNYVYDEGGYSVTGVINGASWTTTACRR